jgi:hypothetical protein
MAPKYRAPKSRSGNRTLGGADGEGKSELGYGRIVGALANLGHRLADQTVGNVLRRHGISPAPKRKQSVSWKSFIRSHRDVLVGMDLGWIVTFVSLSNPTAQISVMRDDNPSTPLPNMSIEVADVDEVHARAIELGLQIVYPLPTGSLSTYPLTFNADSHSQKRMSSWPCSFLNYSGRAGSVSPSKGFGSSGWTRTTTRLFNSISIQSRSPITIAIRNGWVFQ